MLARAALVTLGAGCSDCPPDERSFQRDVWPTLNAQCLDCHRADHLARDTRFMLTRDASRRGRAANQAAAYAAATLIAETSGEPLLLLNATATVAHTGGARADEGTADYDALAALVHRANDPAHCE